MNKTLKLTFIIVGAAIVIAIIAGYWFYQAKLNSLSSVQDTQCQTLGNQFSQQRQLIGYDAGYAAYSKTLGACVYFDASDTTSTPSTVSMGQLFDLTNGDNELADYYQPAGVMARGNRQFCATFPKIFSDEIAHYESTGLTMNDLVAMGNTCQTYSQ